MHIINSFEHGGAETMLRNVLLRRDRDRFDVRVVTLIDAMAIAGPVREAGIPIDTLGMRPGVPDPRAVPRLAKLLRRLGPEVIQTWMDHSNLIGALGARLGGGFPVVWGVHHSDHVVGIAKRTTLWTVDAGARLSRFLTRRIVFCSEHAQRLYAQRGFAMDRSLVIPNGFDLSVFHPDPEARISVRRELGIDEQTPLIGLVARYDPFKDHATFLKAAAVLAERAPQVRFVMCGSNVDDRNQELMARITQLGLQNRVFRLGPRRDVARIQAALDIATSSSVSEAFPLVLGEAMACGVPCVATDVGDSRLIVGDMGRIVPPRSETQMAGAWREILDMDPPSRRAMGMAARERVEKLFDLEVVTRRYESLWAEVAGGAAINGNGHARGAGGNGKPAEHGNGHGASNGNGNGHAKGNGHSNGHGLFSVGSPRNGNGYHSPPLRILLIVESSSGGTGRHVLDLAQGLISRGCDVHLVYSTRRLDAQFVERVKTIPSLHHVAITMRTAPHPTDLNVLWKLRRYLRQCGPFDIIHGHSSKGGAMARLAAFGSASAAIYTLHGLIMMDPLLAAWKRMFYLSIERGLGARTSRIIAVSPEEARAAVRLGLGRERVVLVPNGVGAPQLRPRDAARRELKLRDSHITLGFVGRLVSQKAPEVLIRAFAAARLNLPNLRLVMVGSGPMERELVNLSRRLGAADSILWTGHRDAREVMAAFDIFVMPSRKEGLPYVVLEAMSAGLPIVAASTAGVEILVEPGVNGTVVPPENEAELALAIVELAADADRMNRFGQASLDMVKRFTIESMVSGTLDHYVSVRPNV